MISSDEDEIGHSQFLLTSHRWRVKSGGGPLQRLTKPGSACPQLLSLVWAPWPFSGKGFVFNTIVCPSLGEGKLALLWQVSFAHRRFMGAPHLCLSCPI